MKYIDAAVKILKSCYRDKILEIRLQGSVSRGEEIPEVSDLDVLCILTKDNDTIKSNELLKNEKKINSEIKFLTGIDINIVNEKYLQENYDYWLIVCSDSLCLYGNNKYYKKEIIIDGKQLAKLWAPDTQYLIGHYRKCLAQTVKENEIRKISRLVGKDLIKSFRPELMKEYNIFHKTIYESCNDLCAINFTYSEYYISLLDQYLNPTNNKKEILALIDNVENMRNEQITT